MAQNNRLKYYISFEADTKKAKSQIDEMMRSLQQVNAPKNVISELFNGDDLRKARANVAELETMLKNAVNVDTGRLDLSKLNRSLRSSNKTLSNFASSFSRLGEEGRHAFSKITEAVLRGEAPLRRRNGLFDKMAETMRNTVRWQISATALNAFTSSIQNAYRYAEDLNRSLNDIRIVTGQSVEQMDAFATKANKAARELSVSTKAYADAALIFYQQGLDDNEVLERTNAVMKMSNVTGETAADVSSYMTAIWNNFDNGSKSLEYYGDVITKLGAATAASSEEIAGGLEKFAAVADTVGLSYEYASAALATIIDRTRQSEDVVGTSLRTIFARLSSLSLGETLEDGVDLTKYTKALDTVGVKVLDQNGQLKEMDIILDELGTKWGGLNDAQKQALATTVAGVRQYSQLIALMDNYDLFKVNVDLAIDSEGTLTEQSKIFEESWLGAKKRVTAALEGIYDTLLEDKVFIFLTNGLASILELVDWIIDRAGGLPGMLGLAGLAIQKVFGRDIKQVVDDLFYGIRTQMGRTQRDIGALMQNIARQNEYVQGDYDTQTMQASLYSEQAKWASQILTSHKQITDELRDQLKIQQITNQAYVDAAVTLEKDIEKRRRANAELQNSLPKTKEFKAETADLKAWSFSSELNSISSKEFRDQLSIAIDNMSDDTQKAVLRERLNKIGDLRSPLNKKALEQFAYDLDNPKQGTFNHDIKASFIGNKFGKNATQKDKIRDSLINSQAIDENNKAMLKAKEQASKYKYDSMLAADSKDKEKFKESYGLYLKEQENIKELQKQNDILRKKEKGHQVEAHEVNEQLKQERINREELNKLNYQQKESLESMFSTAMSGAFKAMSAWSALSAGIKALGDETLSVEQKFTSFVTSFTMGSMQAASAINEFSKLGTLVKDFEIEEGTFLSKITDGAKDLKGALIALGPKIGLVAAGFAAIIAILKIWEEQKPETAIKHAEERTQEVKKAAAEAKQEYLELKNTIDGFTDQYNAIEDMVVGTEEWAAAVSEVNNNLQEVIDKYGLVANTDYIYKNGVIVLTSEGEKKVLGAAQEEANKQELIAKNAQIKEQEIKNNVANDQLKKDIANALSKTGIDANADLEYAEEVVNKIFEDKNIKTFNLDDFKDELIKNNVQLSPEQSQEIFNTWFKNKNAESDFNKQLFASNFATVTPQDVRDAGFETQWNMAASELYSKELQNIREKINSKYISDLTSDPNSGIEQAVYGDKTEDGKAAKYKAKDEDGNYQYFETYEDLRNYLIGLETKAFEEFAETNKELINQAVEEDKALYLNRPEEATEIIETNRNLRVDNRRTKSELEEKDIEEYQAYLKETYKIADELTEEVAVANMRLNRGMEDVLDNWEEYKQILTENNKGTAEYVTTLDAMKQAMAEIAGVDAKDVTEKFLLSSENQALLDKAYLGDLKAIDELRKNLMESIGEDIQTLDDESKNHLNNLINNLDLANKDLKIGMTLDDAAMQEVYGAYIDFLNDLLAAGKINATEAAEYINAAGLVAQVEVVEHPIESNWTTSSKVDLGDGIPREVSSDFKTEGNLAVPQIRKNSNVRLAVKPGQSLNLSNRNKAASNASSRRKDSKKADEEIERYHLIKETIEDLNRELDRLGKEKDRAWGNAHLQYIDREIAKTQEAIDAQKEYLSQIEENYGKDRSKLAGYGAEFDKNGRLTNYEELMQAQIAKYNAAVRSGSETQQEAAEEQFNNFKKALEQYEETADLFESEYEQLLDLQNQYYDKLLERIQYKVEVDVQISEEADKYYDYILDMLEDKAYSAAEAIAYLGKKTDESLKRIASYQEALNSMFEMHGFGDDAYERFANGELSIEELATAGFTSQEIDMLIKYRGALMEENKQLMEMRDQVMSSLTDTFDEYMDTLDKMIDKFDHLNAVTSAYKNIVDIVGKKALGISNDMLRAMDEATVATAENTVKASKDRLDAAEAAMADMAKLEEDYQEAMANANKATSEDEKLYWLGEAKGISDAMEHIEEESRAAKEAFLGSWEEALTTAREVFESNVQLAMEEFENAVSGIYGSLDAMKEAYDQNKVLREQYLEEYERIYELNKLNRDITNSMDDIDSIAAKQTLRDLQEEINQLQRSGAQISKYDLDMLRMRYELRLAEIALEDAQNAKSQVRMSRDNDGNWSYVYTADEGAVADAQQGYEDKMMAMQQISNDYLDQISEQWIATTIEMEQAYQKIYEDRTLSDEERMAAIDRLTEYYGARFDYFNEQITNALGNNKILYEEDWLAWADKNNIQIESNNSFQTSFEDTVLGLTTDFTTIDGLHQALLNAVGRPGEGGYLGDLSIAYNEWQTDIQNVMNAAGTSVEGFGKKFEKVAEDTVKESDSIADSVEDMSERMKTGFGEAVSAAVENTKKYSGAIAEAIKSNDSMISSLGDLLRTINNVTRAQVQLNKVKQEGLTSVPNVTIPSPGGTNPGTTTPTGAKKTYRIVNAITGEEIPGGPISLTDEEAADYERKNQHIDLIALASGGYTGEWGDSSGRIALLHEKELVLNKDDTENFLSAINIVRDIVKVVDMNAAISGMGIGALAASGIAGAGSTIEQSVTIYADFPNATNHSEIELALANLMNSASQYANRKG